MRKFLTKNILVLVAIALSIAAFFVCLFSTAFTSVKDDVGYRERYAAYLDDISGIQSMYALNIRNGGVEVSFSLDILNSTELNTNNDGTETDFAKEQLISDYIAVSSSFAAAGTVKLTDSAYTVDVVFPEDKLITNYEELIARCEEGNIAAPVLIYYDVKIQTNGRLGIALAFLIFGVLVGCVCCLLGKYANSKRMSVTSGGISALCLLLAGAFMYKFLSDTGALIAEGIYALTGVPGINLFALGIGVIAAIALCAVAAVIMLADIVIMRVTKKAAA